MVHGFRSIRSKGATYYKALTKCLKACKKHAARLQTAICWQLAALADSLQSACKVGRIAALATYLCTTFGKLYGGGTANSLFDLL